MLLKAVILSASIAFCFSCAPRIYVPGIRIIHKGEPAYTDGFILTDHELQMLGDIKIDDSKK